ncbi:DUF423 domain-containing protein [Hyphomicrobium sp.]|jgi:uncharacterized membrane protein YgdD (TMEM256/DUF423 family)|uniref:DUF423 domain-containing protein n=1 Tax=Hyphomicrobium sp. TaxID=82 RepID=UPI0035622268
MAASDDNEKGAPRSAPFLIPLWAGLAGAAGVGLSAAAAHKVDSPALSVAATILTLHATAALAIFAVAARSARPTVWSAAALLMLFAASLFSGEIAFYTFTDNASFQFLAPIGGTGLIASWLLVAVAGLVSRVR